MRAYRHTLTLLSLAPELTRADRRQLWTVSVALLSALEQLRARVREHNRLEAELWC